MIQNQHGAGKIAKKWDKTGIVIEDLGFDKYRVKVDGSGRVTDRNRQFLRKFTPVTPGMPGPKPNTGIQLFDPTPAQSQVPSSSHSDSQTPNTLDRSHIHQHFDPSPILPETPISSPSTPRTADTPSSPTLPSFETPPSSPVMTPMSPEIPAQQTSPETPVLPRRSTRVGQPPVKLTYDENYKQIFK